MDAHALYSATLGFPVVSGEAGRVNSKWLANLFPYNEIVEASILRFLILVSYHTRQICYLSSSISIRSYIDQTL